MGEESSFLGSSSWTKCLLLSKGMNKVFYKGINHLINPSTAILYGLNDILFFENSQVLRNNRLGLLKALPHIAYASFFHFHKTEEF